MVIEIVRYTSLVAYKFILFDPALPRLDREI